MGKGKRTRDSRSLANSPALTEPKRAELAKIVQSECRKKMPELIDQFLDDETEIIVWCMRQIHISPQRIKAWCAMYQRRNEELKRHYEMTDPKAVRFICHELLLREGIDISKWEAEQDGDR